MPYQHNPTLACAMLRGTVSVPQLSGRLRLCRRSESILIRVCLSGLPAKQRPDLFPLRILVPQTGTLLLPCIPGSESGTVFLTYQTGGFTLREVLNHTAEVINAKNEIFARGEIREIEGTP